MTSILSDTIAAPITGSGLAAVAIIRLSGPAAWGIASRLFTPWPKAAESRRVYYGSFSHGDDGLLLLFAEGHSYTGDACAELQVHGSPAGVASLLSNCYAAGARPARPGEFTERAFMAGRIDLAQAEGVRATIEARTSAQFVAAARLREGALSQRLMAARDQILSVLTAVEASTDFSEEIGEIDVAASVAKLDNADQNLSELLRQSRQGNLLREGLRIAIVGRPNAGKSSLLNALVGRDRAIVSAIPGTTRDTVEEVVDLDGLPVRFVDTAGLRVAQDAIEQIGIDRSQASFKVADLALYIVDATIGWTHEDDQAISNLRKISDVPIWTLYNKADAAANAPDPRMSAATGEGVPDLVARIQEFAGLSDRSELLFLNARHEPLAAAAASLLLEAKETLQSDRPNDLASVQLRGALDALGQITGETVTADVLERIFHDFCIGK